MLERGRRVAVLTNILGTVLLATSCFGAPADYFRIRVVDEATSRGVPLIKLTTINGITHYTDSAGQVAFNEPGWMNREVFFNVEGPGYTFHKDGFGFPGLRLKTTPGTSATISIHRDNIAQRLYRLTGAGIYLDSVLLGDKPPIREPIMNSSVVGQDSVIATVYRGRIFWIFGDTGYPSYPLAANFQSTGALSDLPTSGGFAPSTGVNLEYFRKGDFVKPMVLPAQRGVYWLYSMVALPDAKGRETLVANCVKIKPPMDTESRFQIRFNDATQDFEKTADDPLDAIIEPDGHPFRLTENGREYVVYPGRTQLCRVPATVESVADRANYEAYTCLKSGSRFDGKADQLDRTADGKLLWTWKRNTSPVGQAELDKLETSGIIRRDERWLRLQDAGTGKPIQWHNGSIYWNEWRKKWVMIVGQFGGASMVGEVWYAEAPAPTGPWVNAVKIATHPAYSFYNPTQHPFFDEDGGRVIYFEGTYTKEFSGNLVPVPRYDYNQIMYKLELDDPRLKPAQSD
ncbi:MAG: DUF4185 domain-containing protein [Candidatus Sumerlaeaceae bacterium]|nr:DUF4185 domain-containing protein [Candidatus Sumerlaeaceae bacterium]